MSESKLFQDIKNAILDDGYIWAVIHGPPRSSKSTLALHAGYYIYQDWDKVIDAIIFNLPSLMNRIETGKPCRWPTVNGLHRRVPLVVYDDFGVHSNKADTQHSSAWDIFKGGFDCIGTELGVLLATMVNAEEATSQLQNKYNVEITVKTKGHYKYDKVEWLQDYKGFRTRMKKTWVENGTFDPIPKEVYQRYDQMRMELTKEVFVRIKDALSYDNMDFLLRMLKPEDEQFLRLIDNKGPTRFEAAIDTLQEKTKDTITRCRARNLIISVNAGKGHCKYEISQLGKDLLMTLDSDERASQRIDKR
jgi:hypothetical protein